MYGFLERLYSLARYLFGGMASLWPLALTESDAGVRFNLVPSQSLFPRISPAKGSRGKRKKGPGNGTESERSKLHTKE